VQRKKPESSIKGTLNVAGAALSYQLDGPASSEVIMLANSLAADMRMWEANLPALTARYRVLRYDMRGHGESSTSTIRHPIAVLTDDAVALLDELRLENVHFVGLSMGGVIGQQLGARHSERLRSLVLSNTMSEQVAPQVWTARMEAVRAGGIATIVEGTISRWFTPSFLENSSHDVAWVRAMILGTCPEAYIECADALRGLSQSSILPHIATPTLVITGQADIAATPAMAHQMQSRIPHAQIQIIESAAHLPCVERPEAFTDVLLRFIAGHAAGG